MPASDICALNSHISATPPTVVYSGTSACIESLLREDAVTDEDAIINMENLERVF
jgi:hypothetical protein